MVILRKINRASSPAYTIFAIQYKAASGSEFELSGGKKKNKKKNKNQNQQPQGGGEGKMSKKQLKRYVRLHPKNVILALTH